MPFDVTWSQDQDFLRFEITGARKPNQIIHDAKTALIQISGIAKEHNSQKILIISKVTGTPTLWVNYETSAHLSELGFDSAHQVAFVDLNPDSFEMNKFAEMVAVNRGFMLGVFDNEPEAYQWLSSDS